MAKLRNDCNKNFTIINNYILQSCFVSLKAVGMYAKLVSLPDNWKFTEAGLIAICKESQNTVRSTLNELEELNLLFRFQVKSDDGRFSENIYYISSKPMSEEDKKQIVGNEQNVKMLGKSELEPIVKNPITVNPISENEPQLNTKIINTKIINNKESKKEEKSFDEIINDYTYCLDLKTELKEFLKMRKLKKKPMTNHALSLALKKLDKIAVDDESKIQIVQQSIEKCWDTFYEIKENKTQLHQENSNPFFDILKEEGEM